MDIGILEDEHQYRAYLARMEEIFEAPGGSPEAKELELLALLVNKYEQEHYPVRTPDPIEFIRIRMEELGLRDKDLVPYLGDKGAVSKVLRRKRKLSVDMVRRLHKGLGIPLDVLVQDYEVRESEGLKEKGKPRRNAKQQPHTVNVPKARHRGHA